MIFPLEPQECCDLQLRLEPAANAISQKINSLCLLEDTRIYNRASETRQGANENSTPNIEHRTVNDPSAGLRIFNIPANKGPAPRRNGRGENIQVPG